MVQEKHTSASNSQLISKGLTDRQNSRLYAVMRLHYMSRNRTSTFQIRPVDCHLERVLGWLSCFIGPSIDDSVRTTTARRKTKVVNPHKHNNSSSFIIMMHQRGF